MSKEVILVLGSVTAKEYGRVRLEMLREGIKTQIIRSTVDELFLETEALVERYASDEGPLGYGAEFEEAYARADMSDFERYAAQHLAQYGNITTVVMDQASWEEWSSTEYPAAALRQLSPVRWLITDGYAEYIG